LSGVAPSIFLNMLTRYELGHSLIRSRLSPGGATHMRNSFAIVQVVHMLIVTKRRHFDFKLLAAIANRTGERDY
jgi:hypothetical protein